MWAATSVETTLPASRFLRSSVTAMASSVSGGTTLTVSNLELLRWFARKRGLIFAFGVVPLQVLYYVLNGIAAGTGMLLHAARRRPRGAPEP